MPGDPKNPEDWWKVELQLVGDPTVWHFEWDWRYRGSLTDFIRGVGPDGIVIFKYGERFRQVMVRAIAWYEVIK